MVESTKCVEDGAWIYIGMDLNLRIGYVGQTSNSVLSRWRTHLTVENAGFQYRLSQYDETAFEVTRPAIVFWKLPDNIDFRGSESSYREAVEYLVQVGFRQMVNLSPKVELISTVRTNPRVQLSEVKIEAEKILRDLEEGFPHIFEVCKHVLI